MNTRPPDTDTVRAQLAALLPGLRARYGVRSLSIFGSYARGEQTAASDLDVLVDFDRPPTLYTLGGLLLDLKEALKLDVHLSHEPSLRAPIRRQVVRDQILVGT